MCQYFNLFPPKNPILSAKTVQLSLSLDQLKSDSQDTFEDKSVKIKCKLSQKTYVGGMLLSGAK